MSAGLEPLRERLLRGGIGRRHARRYLAELRDHLDDLVAEETAAGRPPAAARERALARLGDVDALAQAMTARRELRAWSARAPAVAYVLAPPLALVVGAGLSLAAVVLLLDLFRPEPGGPASFPGWTPPLVEGVVVFVNAVLAVVLGWGLAIGASLGRAPSRWPLLGFVVLAAAGAALHVEVTLPLAGAPGEIELESRFDGPLLAAGGFLARFLIDLVAILAAHVGLSVWRAERTPDGRAAAP